ncbi:GntR family transcriptional regulator [Cytobacillus sp. FSL W7-1323]|uniref:HTH gntR-type domain-containing protein n=1 Tax=Cytobacillus kochii TaxID=859143 RepID=A0A248TKG3_9BACI|nr:GntR family transcriptional regulator [Cytobacillus kochii]ASV68619.1 hypothetical protein CKF48_15810 [Cytobacillus kochii]MCA1028751.1 GntR family transcriptional regulator [Cytobacillus kochii]MDM5208882.1 GntR family transcriptional regulator [Cytobacillus kochii]MDQ0186154.1 DNA-binding GntR family transcriptional regulator [Cytobacillus kochii]
MISIMRETLTVQVYQHLKKRLLDGYYPGGERLIEVKIAEEFNVSRGPVREALKMLIQEELVVQNGNTLKVFSPSLTDMIQIYQIRQQLESFAAKLSAKNIENSDLELLESIIDQTKQAWLSQAKEDVVRLSIQFHEIILSSSGNDHLVSLTNTIRDKVTYFRNSGIKIGIRDESCIEEHAQILAALKERDSLKAANEMYNHIEQDLLSLQAIYK